MLKSLLAPALWVVIALSLSAPAPAQETSAQLRTLSLTGAGEVRAAPDMAMLTLGVISRGKTARNALDASAAMTSVLASLRAAGIEEKDLQTSAFAVNPVYVYDNNTKEPPKITGYEVSNQVVATVRKLAGLGSILDEAVSKGSNQVLGIAFSLADPQALEDEARKSAVADATRKAKLYAEAAGVALDRVQSISEQVVQPPRPVMMKARAMDAAQSAVPIAEGEQVIRVEVAITWTIR